MKYKYYASFVSGTQEIVKDIIKERLNDLNILLLMDGAIVFETSVPYASLNFFCFNNIFLVLDEMKSDGIGGGAVNKMIGKILSYTNLPHETAIHSSKIKTFRVVVSEENQLVSVDRRLKSKLENKIANFTKLTLKKSESDTEFWILFRREGFCYFLKRLSKHKAYDKILHKGELHPELAYMMCKIANPKHSDAIVDPFCGYGAIPEQRAKRFAFSKIYAFDIDEGALKFTKNKFKKFKLDSVIIQNVNVMQLDAVLGKDSVDAIITDPPWGMYGDFIGDLKNFYMSFMSKFQFILKQSGVVVLLTAQKELFEKVVKNLSGLVVEKKYDILVSGKKSAIYKLKKL